MMRVAMKILISRGLDSNVNGVALSASYVNLGESIDSAGLRISIGRTYRCGCRLQRCGSETAHGM